MTIFAIHHDSRQPRPHNAMKLKVGERTTLATDDIIDHRFPGQKAMTWEVEIISVFDTIDTIHRSGTGPINGDPPGTGIVVTESGTQERRTVRYRFVRALKGELAYHDLDAPLAVATKMRWLTSEELQAIPMPADDTIIGFGPAILHRVRPA